MEKLYFFILGKTPTLSTAEIINQINGKVITISDDFLILETREKLDVQALQEKLGGTIKIGEIMLISMQVDANFDANIIRKIGGQLTKIGERTKKVYFGFSFYGDGDLIRRSKKWAMEIKKELRKREISSRWVTSKEKILSSVIVQKNKLLTDGVEFCFFDGMYVGKTLSCQQFENYGRRDFNRPVRNIKEGMLPPKLAKIMINLALELSEGAILLDPFCGSGTIIQEAILMGYRNIMGIDINQKAIENTQKNIDWLLENSELKSQISNLQLKIQRCDARNLSEKITPNSVDAIVTEPYLGPIKIENWKLPARFALRSKAGGKTENLISELSDLYLKVFEEFKKVLKPNGKVVIIFPIFKIDGKLNFLPILEELKKSGWQIVNLIPKKLRKNQVIKITARNSIIYSRPNQKVLREILILKQNY